MFATPGQAVVLRLKAHVGVDSKRGPCAFGVHVGGFGGGQGHAAGLLHGDERKVWGDGAYQGREKRSGSQRRRRKI